MSLKSIEEYKAILKEKYKTVNDKEVEERYLHSLSVGKKAREIVQRFGFPIDLEKIEIAGILHDYAKFEPYSKFVEIVNKYNLDKAILNEPIKILHALLGSYIVKEEVGITDEQILNAITYHATGSLDMDRFAEVIFVADVAEDLRKGEGFKRVKELALTDFNKAILEKITFNLQKNPTKLNQALYEKYSKKIMEV